MLQQVVHLHRRCCANWSNLSICVSKLITKRNEIEEIFFLWWSAPQQMLRAHRSLEAYCATLWWRWLVLFFVSPCNGAPVEWNWQGKTEVLGENPVPVPLCPPQIPHGLNRDRTRASVVRGRRLTAWAMARPWRELPLGFKRSISVMLMIQLSSTNELTTALLLSAVIVTEN
jgi:hypothetical protein